MKYIVVGGAGFIGSHLVDKAVSEGHEVHVIDNFSYGKRENCNNKAIYHEYDISDTTLYNKFIHIMNNATCVFHLAAMVRVQPSIDNPIMYEKNNTIGTINMLKCAHDAQVKRFIYSGSAAVYGDTKSIPNKETDLINPLSPYAVQKYYGEVICKMFSKIYNIETVCLRYFNVYGERQPLSGAYAIVIGIFLNQYLNKKKLTITGDGEQKRDFIYVQDVVHANILASKSNQIGKGEIINIGNGNSISINQIADFIGGERIYIDKVLEPRESLACNKKAKKLLNWEPTMLVEDWIKKYKYKKVRSENE